MRKFAFGLIAILALAFAGALAWKAEAFPFIPPVTKSSPVENVGCGGPGRCPWGRHWVCRPAGCWCAPCGGYYGPRVYRPYGYRPYVRRWRY
jgi:hypothetical protein